MDRELGDQRRRLAMWAITGADELQSPRQLPGWQQVLYERICVAMRNYHEAINKAAKAGGDDAK